jgi:hypothetical protein
MNLDGLPPVIKLQELTKVFSTEEVETHALSNVSLEIERGEYVSIAGPSGFDAPLNHWPLGLPDQGVIRSERPPGRRPESLRTGTRP